MISYSYRIDSQDRLIHVDEQWIDFARENWDPDFQVSSVIGVSLWDFIRDETTRHLYQAIVAKLRSGDKTEYKIPFRCDSPNRVRDMEMVVKKGESGGITFTSILKREQKREAVAPHICARLDEGPVIRMCSWCKKIYHHEQDEWLTLEEALQRIRYFEKGKLPYVTHGICEECRESLLKNL
ncbi:hypothetical protein JXR74_00620 [Candidatus Mcinerneyibacteriota bacterium]|nr:hypothetical protein [Candidatus Mcinerneyibacteriota bacterium]